MMNKDCICLLLQKTMNNFIFDLALPILGVLYIVMLCREDPETCLIKLAASLPFGEHLRQRTTLTLLFTTDDFTEMTCAVAHQLASFPRSRVHVMALAADGMLWRTEIEETDDGKCEPGRRTSTVNDGAFNTTTSTNKTRTYFELIKLRFDVTIHSIRTAPLDVKGVFVLDSDVVLLRNVAARMARYETDFVFQSELPCAEQHCINAGVWWARARRKPVLAVLEKARSYMQQLHLPDQDALQRALAYYAANVTVAYLPPHTHPNGFVYAFDDRLRRERLHLVHMNWAPSRRAKFERLADMGVVARHRRCFTENYASMHNTTRANGLPVPEQLVRPTLDELRRVLGCETRECVWRRSSAARLLQITK